MGVFGRGIDKFPLDLLRRERHGMSVSGRQSCGFLKKYWALLGGEDGELIRQSEWWRNIRGDDTPDIEVYS